MKIFKGTVKSKKMEKTATVEVVRLVSHPIYLKRYKRTRVFQVHDEMETKVGDKVRFVACRPYSKSKRWIIIGIEGGEKRQVKVSKKELKPRVQKKATRRRPVAGGLEK